MGRFHPHPDGTMHVHDHDHDHEEGDGEPRDVGDHSGYTQTGTARIEVLEDILSENDRVADANQKDFADAGVRVVNIMSSPGAGKTTLLKRTLSELAAGTRIGILEGDIATSIDADQLEGYGAAVSLVNTSAGFGGECHLDAVMVRSGLARLPLAELDLLLIENVGNLVCPALFDLGERSRVVIASVTEGDDKPIKYPHMFRQSEVMILNKIDLLPYVPFNVDRCRAYARAVNPHIRVIQISALRGDGLDEWYDWLRKCASDSLH
jgi:hydrogenase nickel incorporation protein HypB